MKIVNHLIWSTIFKALFSFYKVTSRSAFQKPLEISYRPICYQDEFAHESVRKSLT